MAGAVYAATGLPLVGLTLAAKDRAWSGRFWTRTGPRTYEPSWCDEVREAGDAFAITLKPSPARDSAIVEELTRTVTAWGEGVQRKLMSMRIGIAGLGSVGSIVAEILARIGVSRLLLLDFDRVENINLDRLLNATRADVGQLKTRVAAASLRDHATSPHFNVEPREFSICEEQGFREALDCDLLFSCVDRPWPRSVLNFLAYAHLIPVVDGGIFVSRINSKKMRGADWKAHVAAPGRRCLACLQQYDPGLVAAEREGYLDDPSYLDSLPEDHPIRCKENVFAFSSAVASLEVLQMLSMFVGPAGLTNYGAQTYHFATGNLDLETKECEAWCAFPKLVARGDRAGHPGTGKHEVAERARMSET